MTFCLQVFSSNVQYLSKRAHQTCQRKTGDEAGGVLYLGGGVRGWGKLFRVCKFCYGLFFSPSTPPFTPTPICVCYPLLE